MPRITEWMDKTFYTGYNKNWDNIRFREFLDKNIKPSDSILDYGAGRGNVKEMDLHDAVGFIAGVDINEAVLDNPYLCEASVIDRKTCAIPYGKNSFDVVVSDNVLEHVEDPETVFKEIWRVLKPGGKFIAKTPNTWHYVPLIARTTPTNFHRYYNQLRGRIEADTFPTIYKCNSRASLERYADKAAFKINQFQLWEGRPEYLRICFLTYVLGCLYERIVNSTERLSLFRCVIVFELKKI